MISGNTEGVRKSYLEELEGLCDLEPQADAFIGERVLRTIARLTGELNREISVYISREGAVLEVMIGTHDMAPLSQRSLRRNLNRLSGIRCVHTHPGGDARLSDVDIRALRTLKFDAMCAVGVKNGFMTQTSAAFLDTWMGNQYDIRQFGPVAVGLLPHKQWLREIDHSDTLVGRERVEEVDDDQERAILISVDSEQSLDELAALADTAGALVVDRVLQKLPRPDTGTYLGSGKAKELLHICQAQEIDLIIADDELSVSQQRNLEETAGVRVVDRTALILDIFALHAQTHEGKLQVELAQMKYQLPRLTGLGTVLSRLAGGIGTRGPGESKLEYDRRHIRRRITELSREIKEVEKQREVRRQRREKAKIPVAALVGYTNAGKSTLLNALSGSDVLVEDKLFATLDPVTRRLSFPERGECLLVDTVGFVSKLPHQVVEAFQSTLEEALRADLLVVVSDGASPNIEEQRRVVAQVLGQLGGAGKPVLEVLNKCDIAPEEAVHSPGVLPISALTGQGLSELVRQIAKKVLPEVHRVLVHVPFDQGAALQWLHGQGQVLQEEYDEAGTHITALVDGVLLNRLSAKLGAEKIEKAALPVS